MRRTTCCQTDDLHSSVLEAITSLTFRRTRTRSFIKQGSGSLLSFARAIVKEGLATCVHAVCNLSCDLENTVAQH